VAVEQEILEIIHRFLGGEEVARAIAREEQELRNLQAALQAGAIGFDEFERQCNDVIGRLDALRASSTATTPVLQGLGETAAGFGRLGTAAEGAGGRVASFGRTMIEASRFLQDFQAAGLMGVLNNIEGLSIALGLGSGLAGVLTIVGVAIQQFMPQIRDFLDSMRQGIPREMVDGVEDLGRQLDEAKKRFKELGDQSKFTVSEMFEYLRVRGQVADLERREAERKADERLRQLAPEEDRAAAAGVQRAIGETSYDQARAEVEQALINRAVQQGQAYTLEQVQQEAAGMIREATAGTGRSREARDQIRELLRANLPGPETQFAAGLNVFSPEFQQQEAEFQPEIDRRARAGERRRGDAAQAEKRRGDEAERINREVAQAQAQQQRDREQADREAQRAQDERAREAKQDIDQLMRGVEPTSIGERAAAESARLRLPQMDQFGREYRLTGQQQQLSLRNQIRAELQQAFPGLTRPQLTGLTGRVAEQAETQAGQVQGQQRAAIAQQARAQGQTLRAGELNVMATQRTLMLLQALIPRVEAVEAAAMRNNLAAQQLQARTKPAARRAR
jgi:hypothetical protein